MNHGDALRWYDEHGPALLAYACALLRDPSAAEDVLHQVFLNVLRGRAQIAGGPAAYLFRAVRNACRVVNTIALQSGVAPAAVVMVMRSDVTEYSEKDIVAISELLRTATSDIWMIPYERAGEYKGQDLIVLGEDRVLVLEHKFSSPGEAFSALREMENKSVATQLRGGIEKVATRAVQIRVGGALAPGIAHGIESVESVRALMNRVIVGAIPAEARG